MLTPRALNDERGGVLALSAILIPVFIVLVALLVDVGTWYTHKRQLQNRADAAALAAGVEYGRVFASCAPADLATHNGAETMIASAARTYGGDPELGGPLRNTEVTEQARVNVEINAPTALAGDVGEDTSWDDYPTWDDAALSTPSLGPCDPHPADAISPNDDSLWVQVGVRERDQRSLFGMFGVDLSSNRAHARVELQPVIAGKGFLPIAVPEQNILQANIRYLNYCNPNSPTLMAEETLHTVAAPYQRGGADVTYWAPTDTGNDGGAPRGIPITMPDADACGGDAGEYIPVVTEVRIAGVDETQIDIDAPTQTCANLAALRFADCWTGLSNIRVYKDNPTSEPWFQEAAVGGGTCAPDGYFAVTSQTGTCTFSGSVVIDFNDIGGSSPAADDVDVTIAGQPATYIGGVGFSFPDGRWEMTTTATNGASGRADVSVGWCVHPGNGPCKNSGQNADPHGSKVVQATYRNNNIAPVLKLVRTTRFVQQANTDLEPPMDDFRAMTTPSLIMIYPTIGLQSSLYVGQRRVLRLPHCQSGSNESNNCVMESGSPQDSQSVDCEPLTGGQGHDFGMFATGCDPWYAENFFDDPTWWKPPIPPGRCPDKPELQTIESATPNDQDAPYRCVLKAPGFSPPVIANGIAAAIGNCASLNNNSCQQYACTNHNYYDPSRPNQWALDGPEAGNKRVVFLFIVPYGAYKNTGPQDGLPILDFAAFYITGWEGQGNGGPNQNPCEPGNFVDPDGTGPAIPDEVMGSSGGDVVGYFVSYTIPSAPGNPNLACELDELRPCTPVLVR